MWSFSGHPNSWKPNDVDLGASKTLANNPGKLLFQSRKTEIFLWKVRGKVQRKLLHIHSSQQNVWHNADREKKKGGGGSLAAVLGFEVWLFAPFNSFSPIVCFSLYVSCFANILPTTALMENYFSLPFIFTLISFEVILASLADISNIYQLRKLLVLIKVLEVLNSYTLWEKKQQN